MTMANCRTIALVLLAGYLAGGALAARDPKKATIYGQRSQGAV